MAESAERTRYFERYVTFIDAIAAIAITLLVLPLVELTKFLSASPVREGGVSEVAVSVSLAHAKVRADREHMRRPAPTAHRRWMSRNKMATRK